MPNAILKQLAALEKPRDRWADFRELVVAGEVVEADACGFSIMTSTGTQSVDVPGGMTTQIYENLAPFLSDHEKGLLAAGVVEKLLDVDWETWDRFKSFFYKEQKEDIEEWLSSVVDAHGFDRVVEAIRDEIAQLPPRPPKKPALIEKPKGFVLQYGPHEWEFSTRASTIVPILSALQKSSWKPVSVIEYSDGILDEMQVKQAINQLNHKTNGVIDWHAYTTASPRSVSGSIMPTGSFTKKGEIKTTGVWWERAS